MHVHSPTLIRAASIAAAVVLMLAPAVWAAPLESSSWPGFAPRNKEDSPAAHLVREGVEAQKKGDWATARAKHEAALKLDPNSAAALLGLAGVAQGEGKTQQVRQYLQRAERAAPQSAGIQLILGRYALASEQTEQAEKHFLKASELEPGKAAPLLVLGELYLRMPARTSDALRVYRTAVGLEPKSALANYGLGVALATLGKRDEAVKALDTASDLAPTDPTPLRALGRLYLDAGELEKGLASFDRALKLQPTNVPLMLDRADALSRMGRSNDALVQLIAAERLASGSDEVQFRLANAFQTARKYPEAEKSYLKAISLAPKNPLPYNNLAWMLLETRGNAKRAVELSSKAVELSPRSSPLLDTLGWAQRAAGDLGGAKRTLKKAIDLDPGAAGYHYHLGVVLAELKEYSAARESLEKSLELDPTLPQAEEARKLTQKLRG